MQGNNANPRNNYEGYPDPTAYHGCKGIIREEEKIDKGADQLIKHIKYICKLAGFQLLNRIELQHKKSGKEYL